MLARSLTCIVGLLFSASGSKWLQSTQKCSLSWLPCVFPSTRGAGYSCTDPFTSWLPCPFFLSPSGGLVLAHSYKPVQKHGETSATLEGATFPVIIQINKWSLRAIYQMRTLASLFYILPSSYFLFLNALERFQMFQSFTPFISKCLSCKICLDTDVSRDVLVLDTSVSK